MNRASIVVVGAFVTLGAQQALAQEATSPASSVASSTPTIQHMVVLPWTVAEGVGQNTTFLDEVFLAELEKHVPKAVEVVGSRDIATILDHEQQKQLLGCDDSSCLVELGNALGASHLVVPTVGKMGERYIVGCKVVGVVDASVLFRKVLDVEGEEEVLTAVQQMALELAASRGWAAQPVATLATETNADQEEANGLFYIGAGLAGVGALAAVGLGITAVALDGAVVGDKDKDWGERESFTTWVAISSGGSVLGTAVLVTGGVLLGISLL